MSKVLIGKQTTYFVLSADIDMQGIKWTCLLYTSAPNSTDLTWETVITKNIGLDLGFLNNRLNVSFDAYIRDTKDMLNISVKTINNHIAFALDEIAKRLNRCV